MTDGVNVDFGLLGKPPDYVGDYTNAFNAGAAIGKQTAPTNLANSMMVPPPAADPRLEARVAAMSPAARALAGQRAELLTSVGQGLMGVPYAERPAVLAHMAPALAARGVPAETIARFDPTDGALDAAVESLRSLGAALAQGKSTGSLPA